MKNQLLRYADYGIVFQEVPNEVTLALNITECPHHCDGCHSVYLFQNIGNYVNDDLPSLLEEYKDMITCVSFMGGDQHIDNLNYWLRKIKKEYGLKTCVYSGCDSLDIFSDSIKYLDYLKIGSYKKQLGGLDSKNTNQKFYEILSSDNEKFDLIEKNYLFWKKYD